MAKKHPPFGHVDIFQTRPKENQYKLAKLEARRWKTVNNWNFGWGSLGKYSPLLVAIALIFWAAVSQSNVTGCMAAFFAAIIVGVVFANDEKAYDQAILSGLSKPMFPIMILSYTTTDSSIFSHRLQLYFKPLMDLTLTLKTL